MIKSLFVKNFRNHQELSLSFEKFNYIEGLMVVVKRVY